MLSLRRNQKSMPLIGKDIQSTTQDKAPHVTQPAIQDGQGVTHLPSSYFFSLGDHSTTGTAILARNGLPSASSACLRNEIQL